MSIRFMLRAEIRNLDFKPTPRLLGFNHQADFQFLTVLYQYRLVPRKSFKSGDLKWSFRKITTENFAMLYILFDIEIMFNIREYHKGMYGQYRLSF